MCERGALSEFRAARTSHMRILVLVCSLTTCRAALTGVARRCLACRAQRGANITHLGRSVRQDCCRLTTYRHRFARAAPAPRAKRNDDSKNRGRASPVNKIVSRLTFIIYGLTLRPTPSANSIRPEGRAARGRPGNVWQRQDGRCVARISEIAGALSARASRLSTYKGCVAPFYVSLR